MLTVLLACLVLLVALGLLERFAARRARAAVPIRIHVNGTRGKSTVTRLIAAALREAGIPTIAKVTGTAPRLIRPNGSERPVKRRAPASIREQAWLLREAKRAGAQAFVAECMAIRPDLQWVSEHEMLHATIGVITNVRLDHTEAMGRTVEEIAQSLANGIPRGGLLVTGEARFAEAFAARCASLGTRLVIATSRGQAPLSAVPDPQWWREDVAVALAVTRELGIKDDVAMRGIAKATPDPGAVTEGIATIGGHEVAWVDATAANDPESLDLLVTGLPASVPLHSRGTTARPRRSAVASPPRVGGKPCSTTDPGRLQGHVAQDLSPVLVVYNHRADRPDRLRIFAQHGAAIHNCAAVLLTGDRPSLTLVTRVRRLCSGVSVRFVSRRHLATAIVNLADGSDACRVIFCGNTRGFVSPFRESCLKAPSASASR